MRYFVVLVLVVFTFGCGKDDNSDESSGMEIEAIYSLTDPDTTEICNRHTNINCVFMQGIATKFTDGYVMFEGQLIYFRLVSNVDIKADEDYQVINTMPYYCPPDFATCYSPFKKIYRGTDEESKAVGVVYIRASDSFVVYYDSDGSGAYEASDETVVTLTKTLVR